jgi:hypothetical protein
LKKTTDTKNEARVLAAIIRFMPSVSPGATLVRNE